MTAVYLWYFYVIICAMNIGVNSANDTVINNENANQVVISTPIFHLFIGICLSAIICCACALFGGCFLICYYYSPSRMNKNNKLELNPQNELTFKQVQSGSQTSYPSMRNNASDHKLLSMDSYESTPTKSTNDSDKKQLEKSNKNNDLPPVNSHKYNRSQSMPIAMNLQSGKSGERNQLENYTEKQRRITSGGPDINHKRFNSEELYDITSPKSETPFGNTPNQHNNVKCEHSAADSHSVSTLTLKTAAIPLANPNKNNGEMHMNDNEGNTINTLDSEGDKMTEMEKLNKLKYEARHSKYKQYEMNENHIPDIREGSDLDVACDSYEDDCKTIHHDTVIKHKKKNKKHKKRKKYDENKNKLGDRDADDVLFGIGPQSPFQKHIANYHYHTQPNLKYVPKQTSQPPFIVDAKNKNSTVHR